MKTSPPFTVIYEDENIVAVNKASGISVTGDRWDVARERLDRLVSETVNAQIFTVHRIDCETSGLVVFAKNEETHRSLSLAFEGRNIAKRYLAVVHGRPAWNETVCDLPLVPNGNKQHMTVIDKYRGKKSFTRFTLLAGAGNYSVLEVLPETGRTHQIRVHAAALGCPIACDSLYTNRRSVLPVFLSAIKKNWRGDPLEEKPLLARLALHAAEIILPVVNNSCNNQNILSILAPLPKDIAALIRQMEKASMIKFT